MHGKRVLAAMALLVGCGGGTPAPKAPEGAKSEATAKGDAAADKAPVPGLPSGYTTMFALGMIRIDPTRGAVILSDEQRTVFVPIFIGGTESLSISLRLKGDTYERPLTHDLIDSMLKELNAELAQVQVDALRDQIFIGSILVRDGQRIFRLDARPSDAIALATGNAIPIYVNNKVIEDHGVPADSPDAAPYKTAVFGRTLSPEQLALEVEKLADKACACTDGACLQAVNLELMTLVDNISEDPTADDQAAIMRSVQRMQECAEKLLQPATP